LGRTHIFPGDDVGARNNLQRWLHLAKPLDYEGVRRVQSRWDGYAGLVYFHLLLDRLAEAGSLGENRSEPQGATGAAPHVGRWPECNG
jgi:DNA-3-methyladenine glycosylase II